MLEVALQGILRQQDMSRDNPRELDNFLRQQRMIEKEHSRIMQYLAQASKVRFYKAVHVAMYTKIYIVWVHLIWIKKKIQVLLSFLFILP